MRPAQNARDNSVACAGGDVIVMASMRPAQNARDNRSNTVFPIRYSCLASMRPAQNARDNIPTRPALPSAWRGFNEARAKRTG